MPASPATLHLFCGKIAAGKSTLAKRIAAETGAVLVAEDFWLKRLYPDELKTVADYVRYSARLREVMGPHLVAMLRGGTSVALDFPANKVGFRQWMRGIIDRAGTAHQLHFLDVADETCLARLRARNASGAHDFAASDAEF